MTTFCHVINTNCFFRTSLHTTTVKSCLLHTKSHSYPPLPEAGQETASSLFRKRRIHKEREQCDQNRNVPAPGGTLHIHILIASCSDHLLVLHSLVTRKTLSLGGNPTATSNKTPSGRPGTCEGPGDGDVGW